MSNGDTNVNFGDAGYCSGYLRGLADGMTLLGYSEGTFKITNVSSEDLVRSFVTYANAHPAEMDASDIIVILTKAWKADNIFIATPKPAKQQ